MREQREHKGDRDSKEGQDGKKAGGGAFFRRRKTCPFSGDKGQVIDWKDVRTLGRYISERGKIMPRRISAVSSKKQRELAQAIKRSRFMALMPYVRTEMDNKRSSYERPSSSYDRS